MATAQTAQLCPKCGVNPRGEGSETNPWCKECRAAYQREYEQNRLARKESKGFALGVQAMRDLLCEEFHKLGFSRFEAFEIRDIIRNCAGPKLPD